jgi:hypothetical protein
MSLISAYRTRARIMNRVKEEYMSSKVLSAAVLASFLAGVAAPVVAFAEDKPAPTTKKECNKAPGMKWDKTTKTCVPK